MRVLSLFDGISTGMLALKRAGIPVECYHAYEIEPNAIKVSQKNFPEIVQCGDVTKADFRQREREREREREYDLLIGGSPCQSLSICQSKTRQNLDGKSKLFFEYVRVKNEVNPKYFLFENVASMNDESKGVISELLGCEPIFIDAADFSAQQRPRLYWTNIPVDMNYIPSKAVLKDIMQDNVPEKYYYNCEYDFYGLDKSVCATLHISGHDILKRVHSPNFKCHTLTTCGGGNTQKKVFDNGRPRKLTPLEYERLQTLPDGYTEGIADTHRYTACGNGWCADVITHIFKGLKT